MTYSAPRQGLFAIILLICFCLHTLILVVSTDWQLDKLRMQTGERVAQQLAEETILPLSSHDSVSLSVLANRYANDQAIASLIIRDNNQKILVQTGSAPLQHGEQISQIIKMGDTILGDVSLKVKNNSKGEIIASQWPFILSLFVIYFIIWLLYGYVARPTKAQLSALSRDIQEHYLAQQPRPQRGRRRFDDQNTEENQQVDENQVNNDADTTGKQPFNMQQAVNSYLQSQQSLTQKSANNTSSLGNANDVNKHDKQQTQHIAAKPTTNTLHNTHAQHSYAKTQLKQTEQTEQKGQTQLPTNRPLDVVSIQIVFDDKFHLLDKLALEKSAPYFALCTQLLQHTIKELLKQPLLHGVYLVNQPSFDATGAKIELKAEHSHDKVALAAVMLSKLYIMLNKIIYQKHRELSRFALNVKVGLSDAAQSQPLLHLLERIAHDNDLLILLPSIGLKQLSNHIQLRNLTNPTTVYERECAFVDGTSEVMMQRLVDVRNSVLLSA